MRFENKKAYSISTLRTAGEGSNNCKGFSANEVGEGVPRDLSRWIRNGWSGLDRRGNRGGQPPE